ncbi:endonuclease III domain-containing protein [Hippea maritima]|uniref:HhH-GPD family protein n=1 Tax=Hippea maritima (strain ATCC 700847 / DSM 10411 / MH2) TaxID=760142 RepID=F2LU64_HIPMA|nr:endonuclease III domain-containing protein [Hippea maritima]AEA34527.1 HhH-GPD family protein [Hippea maritima DSM 10411]
MRELLLEVFNKLLDRYGKQHWWPAQTKDEVVIGAILTQNTAWKNVEKAIDNLKKARLCSLNDINKAELDLIKEAIKPAGFFNQKGLYLKNVATFFHKHGGFDQLSKFNASKLRELLLSIKGVGRETADSILLYAFEKPMFVVDAYTKKFLKRHEILTSDDYELVQRFFMENLPKDVGLFNEYHALIVKNAKEYCRTKPICRGCPLEDLL